MLYSLRSLHGKFHEWIVSLKNKISFVLKLSFPLKRKCYVIGTPLHSNLGDSAITLAEIEYIKKSGWKREAVKEITLEEYEKYRKTINKCISKRHLICMLGGGNMGDEWIKEELFRREVLQDFSQNKIIIFPQTIFYTDTSGGREECKKSVSYYNNCHDLTIAAREKTSYDMMKELYNVSDILLVPDIVLSMTLQMPKSVRNGILLCLRSDAEKYLDYDEQERFVEELKQSGFSLTVTDMYSNVKITKENRKQAVEEKLIQFSKAELVVTDRLHGMIFAALTETPCIVLSNYNHKVKGTYDWINYLPYVKYVKSFDEAEKSITDMLAMKDNEFDNKQLLPYFEHLKKKIKC